MATYYSTEYTASLTIKGSTMGNGLEDQVVKKFYTVSLPATATADELIYVTPQLPVGVTVIPWESYVACSADPGAGACAIDVGIVAEDDLATLIDLSSGGKVDFDGVACITTTTAKRYVIAKLETLSSASVGAVTLTFCIAFIGANPSS